MLKVDGFIAALLIREVHMQEQEVREAFYLISSSNNEVAYHDWLANMFSWVREYFSFGTNSKESL